MIIISKALFYSFFFKIRQIRTLTSHEKYFLLMCTGLKSFCKESFDFPQPTKKNETSTKRFDSDLQKTIKFC